MGDLIRNDDWTPEGAMETSRMGLLYAEDLHNRSLDGEFNSGLMDFSVEQESFLVDSGLMPINAESLIFGELSPIVRPESRVYVVEYDSDIVTPHNLQEVYTSLMSKNDSIRGITEANLLNIGLHPLLDRSWDDRGLIKRHQYRNRYELLQKDTLRNRKFEEARIGDFKCEPSNNGMSARCVSTQYNVKYPTIGEVIQSYNTMIDITPLFVAMFGNSPFAGGIDTGYDDGRVQTILQTDSVSHFILPRHTTSILSHCKEVFPRRSAFVCENPSDSYHQTYSGVHTTQRIKIDEQDGHARVEFRIGDSMNPFEIIQGALYLMGVTESLKQKRRQPWSHVCYNFGRSVYGMKDNFMWDGSVYESQSLCAESINWMIEGLEKMNVHGYEDFVAPLMQRVKNGVTVAGNLRKLYREQKDIINPINEYIQCGKRGVSYVVA